MRTAADIARALGGHRSGSGYLVRCPVAGHGQGNGDRTPSLLVKDGYRRLLVKCFAGCTTEDILRGLRDRGLSDDGVAARGERRHDPLAVPDRSRLALAIWESAVPLAGTLAENYLRQHRGLTPPFPSSLKFVPDQAATALIAAVHLADHTIGAVQLTYLSSSGTKAAISPARRTIGSLADGAVRVGVGGARLGIAEGVEDALAASQLSGIACWACLGAARMDRVAIPREVGELHVFADDDDPGRGAAERTADRHRQLGRRVVLRFPPPSFKDWGEVVQRPREAA